jgi:AcrR family transcriptional regulator
MKSKAVASAGQANLPIDRKRQIVQIASKLFAERGFSRTTMADIAERLKFTKPILYQHFKNKNEVLLECYRYGSSITIAGLDKGEHECRSGIEKVRMFINVYVDALISEVGTCLVLLEDHDLAEAQRALGKKWRRDVEARLRAYIEEGVRDGTIKSQDVGISVLVISGAMNSLGYWYKPNGRLPGNKVREYVRELLLKALA